MTAYLLQKYVNQPLDLTIFEASERLGGKILTPRFSSQAVHYEAGAAEFYDYSPVDEDPLKALVAELGLATLPMGGNSVVVDGQAISNLDDLRRCLGDAACQSLIRFHWAARDHLTPRDFFRSGGDETLPVYQPQQRFDSYLQQVDDTSTARFIETWIHSDLATEPRSTTIDYGLQNYLMNDPAYMQLYGIVGGNEQLPQALAARIQAKFRMQHRATKLVSLPGGPLEVQSQSPHGFSQDQFDIVVVALPHDALTALDFSAGELDQAMQGHRCHYYHPAHYLRITLLFEEAFWRQTTPDSYWMLDAFGGCCLYDESSRLIDSPVGVLGWLLSGESAQARVGMSDSALIDEALASLPPSFATGRHSFIEGRVHRWINAVNAIPGGLEFLPLDQRHCPAAKTHPGFFIVGDYLFDSTLNGVLDSADYVAHGIAAYLHR